MKCSVVFDALSKGRISVIQHDKVITCVTMFCNCSRMFIKYKISTS